MQGCFDKKYCHYVMLDKSRDECGSEGRSPPTTSTTQTGRRGSLQLWQFLVALLDAPDSSAGCIAWTGRGMEFKLIEPEEVITSSCTI